MSEPLKVIIIGAAGRDFHDFNVYWKNQPNTKVICFTATQIPNISGRKYPPELAGDAYPDGIPIYPQEQLAELIKKYNVDVCQLAYSDISYQDVMSLGAEVNAAGANYVILSPKKTQLTSKKPILSITAVRTGCGKSQTTRYIADLLRKRGKKVAVVRHPMPYGNLMEQRCQRYAEPDDLKKYHCTLEEYEEYEQHIEAGNLLFAGIDYEMILRSAEKEADVILWDGGNNDLPFFKPDIAITVADPLRAGDEISYYPGETNCLMADLIILNKVNSASQEDTKKVQNNLASIAEKTPIVLCDSILTPEIEEAKGKDAEKEARKLIQGKKVLTIDDGPTLTHGGMPFGAATALARDYSAEQIIDPRPFAHGTIKKVFEKFKHLQNTLPCMGYGEQQISDLQKTVDAASEHVDTIVFGTPINLNKLVKLEKPWVRARYALAPRDPDLLQYVVERVLKMKSSVHQTEKEPEQAKEKQKS